MLFVTGEDRLIEWWKKELTERFEMKDLGLMHYFLGLEVWQNKDGIFLAQGKYTMDILKRFGMLECTSMATPMISNLKKLHDLETGSALVDPTMYRQLISSLLYLAHTQRNICYSMSVLSQFMIEPRHRHWVAAKHILRYLKGTITYGLSYSSNGGISLHGYADSNWVGSLVDKKNTISYSCSFGSAMISWSSRKQGSIAHNTTEAEYIAASDACKEAEASPPPPGSKAKARPVWIHTESVPESVLPPVLDASWKFLKLSSEARFVRRFSRMKRGALKGESYGSVHASRKSVERPKKIDFFLILFFLG
eukprot:PITA_25501